MLSELKQRDPVYYVVIWHFMNKIELDWINFVYFVTSEILNAFEHSRINWNKDMYFMTSSDSKRLWSGNIVELVEENKKRTLWHHQILNLCDLATF